MSILDYAALGALGGAGKGAADVGQTISTEALRAQDMRRQEQMRLDEINARADRVDIRQGAREDWQDGRPGGGSGRTAGGSKGGGGALDIASDPTKLALLGGMDPERALDYVGMQTGAPAPTKNLPLDPSRFANPDRQDEAAASGVTSATVPKYSPGDAAGLRDEAIKALYQAVKLADPGHADDLSKSQSGDQVRSYTDDFVGGDTRAGMGALMIQGKAPFGMSGNELTGEATPGSVAASTVVKNNAEAADAAAKATKTRAEVNPDGSPKITIAALGEQRKALASSRQDIDHQATELKGQFGPDVDKARAALATRRASLDRQDDALTAQITSLSTGLTKPTAGPARTAGGQNPTGAPPAALLKPGVNTRFKNGQTWTLQGGVPVQVQ